MSEVILEKEVEQCLFYRANIKESYNDWSKSMHRLGFSDKSIEKAVEIMREYNWEHYLEREK